MDARKCDSCDGPIEPLREITVTVIDTESRCEGEPTNQPITLHFCGWQCLYDWAECRWMYDWEHGE